MSSYLLIVIFVALSFSTITHRKSINEEHPGDKTVRLILRINCNQNYGPCPDNQITVDVVIYNHTDTLISIFDSRYLWGYFNTSFKVKSEIGKDYSVSPKDRDFYKNIPAFKTLFPGDSMVILNKTLILADFTWSPSPAYVILYGNIKTIIAEYQYALDSASLDIIPTINDTIKYKYQFQSTDSFPKVGRNRNRNGYWKIIDSISHPIPLRQTFLLSKLISNEVRIN